MTEQEQVVVEESLFDIEESARLGFSVCVAGRTYAGKTTLIKALVTAIRKRSVDKEERRDKIYGKEYGFPVVVCSLKDTWDDDYEEIKKELGLRKTNVGFNKYYYLKRRFKNALIILEDIPARIINPKTKRQFENGIKSLLSRRRRTTSSNVYLFVTQYLGIIPEDIIPEISLFIFMYRGVSMKALREAFTNETARSIRKYVDRLGKHEYVIFDPETRSISRVYSTYDAEPIIRFLCGEKVIDNQLGMDVDRGEGGVGTKASQIVTFVKGLERFPTLNEKTIMASRLGTTTDYVNKVIWMNNKMGLLFTGEKQRVSKYDRVILLITESPSISNEELSEEIGSTLSSITVMRNKALREGEFRTEDAIKARKAEFERKMKELGIEA